VEHHVPTSREKESGWMEELVVPEWNSEVHENGAGELFWINFEQ
jgi:hypothetical protein